MQGEAWNYSENAVVAWLMAKSASYNEEKLMAMIQALSLSDSSMTG